MITIEDVKISDLVRKEIMIKIEGIKAGDKVKYLGDKICVVVRIDSNDVELPIQLTDYEPLKNCNCPESIELDADGSIKFWSSLGDITLLENETIITTKDALIKAFSKWNTEAIFAPKNFDGYDGDGISSAEYLISILEKQKKEL